jgi:hypothetical protein
MGAHSFVHFRSAREKSAAEAFSDARANALYHYGHNGYTGTIAEKMSFKMLPIVDGKDIEQSAWHYIDTAHPAVDDKYGPAGCIHGKDKDGDEVYCFFGWAAC